MERGKAKGSFGMPELPAKGEIKNQGSFGKPTQEPIPQEIEKKIDEVTKSSEEAPPAETYQNMLKSIGVEFTEEDFNQIIFRGSCEKTVSVVGDNFMMKIKTLKAKEYDAIDEILAEDAETTKMSNAGYENRRSLLNLAASIEEMGKKGSMKKITQQVMLEDGKTVDIKSTIRKKRDVVVDMSPAILNKAIRIHGTFVIAVGMVIDEPGDFAKNS